MHKVLKTVVAEVGPDGGEPIVRLVKSSHFVTVCTSELVPDGVATSVSAVGADGVSFMLGIVTGWTILAKIMLEDAELPDSCRDAIEYALREIQDATGNEEPIVLRTPTPSEQVH